MEDNLLTTLFMISLISIRSSSKSSIYYKIKKYYY